MSDGYQYGTLTLTENPDNLFGERERALQEFLKHYFASGVVTYKANEYTAMVILNGVPLGVYHFAENCMSDWSDTL